MKKINFSVLLFALIISFVVPFAANASVSIEFLTDAGDTLCDVSVSAGGENVTSAVAKAASACGVRYELKYWPSWNAHTLERFASKGGWSDCYWMFDVNHAPSWVGMDDKILNDGDLVTWTLHNSGSCKLPSANSVAGEGIVGLISPSTGGLLDSDNDGVSDVDERKNGTDPYKADKKKEKNTDMLASSASALAGWTAPDSDGDGISDKDELKNGTNPYKTDNFSEQKTKVDLSALKSVLENSKKKLEKMLSSFFSK